MKRPLRNSLAMLKSCWPFAVALAVWFWFLRAFFLGEIPILIDTATHYARVKFFFASVFQGEIPLWEPYLYLGRPFIGVPVLGVLNPFLWLVPLGVKLGLTFYQAYVFWLFFYFLVGCAGVYALGRFLWPEAVFARMAFWMCLFSGLSVTLFNQVFLLLIFVPVPWFFLYFFRWLKFFHKSDFVCLIFWSAVILVSYIPFYFLTLFLVVFCVSCFLFWKFFSETVQGIGTFIVRHPVTVLCGGLFLVSAGLGLLAYKWQGNGEDFITPARHIGICEGENFTPACYEEGSSVLSYEEAGVYGTLGERVIVPFLFAHLDKVTYGTDDFFFIPFFAYILLALGLIARMDVPRRLMFWTGLCLVLIAMGSVTPVHRFLFDRVVYFRYFRNLFFFSAYLLPLMILFAVAQFRCLARDYLHPQKHDVPFLIYTLFVFGLLGLGLYRLGPVPSTTYLTLALTLVVFLSMMKEEAWLNRESAAFILFLLVVVQPVQVFSEYRAHARDFQCFLPSPSKSLTFRIKRKNDQRWVDCLFFQARPDYAPYWLLADLEDVLSPVEGNPDRIHQWVYYLRRELGREQFENYAQYKFIAYEAVETGPPASWPKDRLAALASLESPRALVEASASELQPFLQTRRPGPPEAVTQEGDGFHVRAWNPNSVEMEIVQDKARFWVFNDSFHPDWRAFLDGRSVPVYKANLAFKGVVVPEGRHRLTFLFSPPVGERFYRGLFALMGLLAVWTVLAVMEERRQRGRSYA